MAEKPGDLPELPDATAVSAGELQKSGATRRRILEAGVRLLAEEGYRGFSAVAVAARAGLTRAAMLYHFPTRATLLAAVVHHIVRLRIDQFIAALEAAPRTTADQGRMMRGHMVQLTWETLETPAFRAYVEVVVAARTDPELQEVMEPALAVYDRARRITSRRIMPRDTYDEADFTLARDVIRFLSEGLVGQPGIVDNRAERIAAVKHFMHMLVASEAGAAFLAAVVGDQAHMNGAPQPEAGTEAG